MRSKFVNVTGKERSLHVCDINLIMVATFNSAHCVPGIEVGAENTEMNYHLS